MKEKFDVGTLLRKTQEELQGYVLDEAKISPMTDRQYEQFAKNVKKHFRSYIDSINETIKAVILEDTMEVIEQTDNMTYKKYCMKLYKMAYGNNLTKELAEEIVEKMRPYGEKWTVNQTMDVQEKYGLNDIKTSDFYIVMNSAYNDYHDIFDENIDMYVKFTRDFIQDEDAKEGKVLLYFTNIPK